MRKLLLISLKDFVLIFRDRAALIFMLLAPFALTLGLGLATGSFSSSSSSGISNIPLIVVNDDQAFLGDALVQTLQSEELDTILEPTVMTNRAEAMQLVDDGQTSALVYVPKGFSDAMLSQAQAGADTARIELYGRPTTPISVSIIESFLNEFLVQAESMRIGSEVIVSQLQELGTLDPAQIPAILGRVNTAWADAEAKQPAAQIKTITLADNDVAFNVLGLLASGMALMFLMYTVTFAGNSLLGEQGNGTLPRLLISPTSSVQILGGKVLATIMTGVTQLLILIIATSLLFKLDWGDPLSVLALVLSAAVAATGWGLLLGAVLKTPGQLATIGSVLTLLFGVLSGSFTNISNMPAWVQVISHISPNRWALDGFTTLAMGGQISSIVNSLLGLLVMALVLFSASLLIFKLRGFGRQ